MMEGIRFYDFNFQPIWDIEQVISANWQLYYNDIGTFELHAAAQNELMGILQTHPYLVAVQGEKQAVLTGRRFAGRECVLFGRSCNWLLTRRLTPAFSAEEKNAESACRAFVSEAFADVAAVALGAEAGLEARLSLEQKTDVTTFEAVQDTLEAVQAGHRLR